MAMWHPNRKKHSPVLQNWVLKRDALWGCREIHQDFKSLDKSSCKKQSVRWQTQWLKKPKVIKEKWTTVTILHGGAKMTNVQVRASDWKKIKSG